MISRFAGKPHQEIPYVAIGVHCSVKFNAHEQGLGGRITGAGNR